MSVLHHVHLLYDVQSLYVVRSKVKRSALRGQQPLNDVAGRRGSISEEEFLDAAMTLLGEGGPNAVSVPGIAVKVALAPPTRSPYFPDKAAAIKALGERLLGEVPGGSPRPRVTMAGLR